MFLVNQCIIRLRHVTLQTRNHTSLYFQVVYLWYASSILLLSGDIETNPGPLSNNLEICHWNLNIIAAQNFIKIPLLEAYITVNNFHIICLSETFLDSSFLDDDPRLNLNSYSLIRVDHPSDTKRGGVCIYYKKITFP